MLTFVVDCCVYVWCNAHGLFVNIHVLVIAAVVAMVAHRCSHAMPHVVRSHEALPSDTSRSLLPIVVVVVVAAARRDMKMPGARARGLVVDIRRHHCRSCCRRRCDAI